MQNKIIPSFTSVISVCYICVCVHACAWERMEYMSVGTRCPCGGQRTSFGSCLSPSGVLRRLLPLSLLCCRLQATWPTGLRVFLHLLSGCRSTVITDALPPPHQALIHKFVGSNSAPSGSCGKYFYPTSHLAGQKHTFPGVHYIVELWCVKIALIYWTMHTDKHAKIISVVDSSKLLLTD